MTRMPVTDVREDFADVLNRVAYQHERIILQRHGKDAAVLVSLKDLALLEVLEDRLDLEEAHAALAEAEERGTISWEDLKAKLGL